ANDLVGRKVLRDNGATVEVLLGQIEETVVRLRTHDHGVATRTAERLDRAVAATRRATADLLAFAAAPRDAYASGVPYLMLVGTVAGGWMHALTVDAVLAHPALSDADNDRLTAADFYGAHHLPRVHALAETIAAGEVA